MPPKTKSKRRVKRRPANEDEVDPELEVVKAIATLSDDSSDINKAPLIAVTFLLPDDDEFKDPWSLELSIGNSARIAKVKELLCEELKLSNPDRFRIQLLSGLFAKDENRINEYVDEKATETTFIVRRDINHRVQLAIEARLKSLSINGVSPREKVAGGTTSSFSDDTAHDSLKRIPSLTQYSGATASSTNTPARTDDVIVAPKLRHSPSTEALGEAAAGVLANSEGFVGTEDEPKGWIVEFLFPPLFSPFSNLQKKSMRVNPTLPMIDLKTNLVMKCAPPTTSAKEKQKIIQNLELQSITGVVFRDNDTLSENFYLDQHCTLTLVVRQKPEFGFVKRTSDTDLLEEEGEGEEEEEEEEADDDNDNIKDIGSPSKHHHHHHHHGLNGSPSRDRLLRRQTDSPNRQKRKKKADVPKIPLGSDSPVKDKPQRTKSTTLSKSQSAMNPARNILINEEFRRSSAQSSSTYQNASIPEDAGCIAVFALPPSGVFHGLERKRLLVSPFDSVAIIKRKLLHAIRCDVNPDDYELRTLAKRTRAAIHSSPRGRLDELTQALGQPAGTTLAANPGETYMIIEPDNDPSLPQSPRRITGRAFRGHLFRDDEKLSDYFRLDKADVLELELVGRGNTTKPTSVTNVPAKSNKRNKLHHNPTSLASALSLASLNDVLPIDDMLNKKMRAPILVSPRSRHSSHDGKKLKHSDEHKKGVPRRNSRSKKPKKSDNNDDNVDDTVEAVTSAHSENSENPLKTTSMPKISYAGAVQKVIQDRKTCTLIDSGDEKSSESRAKVPPLSLATQPAVPSYRDAIMKAQKKSSGHSDDNIDLRSPRSPRKRLTFGSDPPAAVAAALPANANLGVGKQTKAQKRRNRKSAFL